MSVIDIVCDETVLLSVTTHYTVSSGVQITTPGRCRL